MPTEPESAENIADDEDTCRMLLQGPFDEAFVPTPSGSSRVLMLPAISSDDAERVLEVERPLASTRARDRWLYAVLLALLVLVGEALAYLGLV